MNSDASPGVAVDVGAKTGVLLPIGVGMAGFALLALAGGAAMIVAGRRVARGARSPVLRPQGPQRPGEGAGERLSSATWSALGHFPNGPPPSRGRWPVAHRVAADSPANRSKDDRFRSAS